MEKKRTLNCKHHNIFGNKWLLTLAVCACIIISGCNKSNQRGEITEGSIKFKITYLKSEQENPIIGLLPSTIMMRFKDDKVQLDMQGWLGIFRSSFIKNDDKNAYTLLKILNNKYLYVSEPNEGYYGMRKVDNMQIDFDNQTKDIIGFDCKHAVITIPDLCKFDVYYTDEIKIKDATANTPLDKIPGMLMDFRLEMNGIPMHLEAIEFLNEEVPESSFEIPEDYTRIERSQMDDIFNSIGQSH